MNKWGTPDWRDAGNYGATDQWNKFRWHWEFLRRRSDLRKEFDSYCEEEYQRLCSLFEECPEGFGEGGVRKPDEPGFTIPTDIPLGTFMKRLPNPRIGNQPSDIIQFHVDGVQQFYEREAPAGFARVDFDLSKPIDAQLKAAKKHLAFEQERHSGRKLQKRRHKSKWLTYLRVLDGREQGASWSELSEILLNMRDDPQAARDVYQQAEALCFNF